MPLALGLFSAYHSSGQGAELAGLNQVVYDEPATERTPAPIADDEADVDTLAPAQQLLISFLSEGTGAYRVEVLDEQGRCVLERSRASRTGRNLLPVDVADLAKGRNAVRVHEGGATRITRFVRP